MQQARAILVTGSAGFVGRAIVTRLRCDGHRVVAGSRSGKHDDIDAPQVALGDLRDTGWTNVLPGIETVVHCAAMAHLSGRSAPSLDDFRTVNRDATERLARSAADAGVRRLIFLSSIGVCGNQSVRPFSEADPANPHSDYAIAKWEAEQRLSMVAAETDLQIVVIRPPLVLGRDPKGNLGTLVSALRRGWPIPLGAAARNRRDLVSVDTLADLISVCIDHPGATGAPLLVSDGTPLSTRQIVERLAALHGFGPRLISVPPSLLRVMLGTLGRHGLASQLLDNLEVDISKTVARLDWTPPTKGIP